MPKGKTGARTRSMRETVRGKEVADRLAALQGRSVRDLMPDQDRQSASPLGMGSGSQAMRKGRRR